MVATWPYWIEMGASAVMLVVATLVAYGTPDRTRQMKFWAALVLYGVTLGVAGAMALHQTYYVRTDGVELPWGRWASCIPAHAAGVVILVLSLGHDYGVGVVTVLLALGSGGALLGGALTPLRNGGDDRAAGIFFLALAAVFAVASALLMISEVFGWSMLRLFGVRARPIDGRTTMVSWWAALLIGGGLLLTLVVYVLFLALGPEMFHVYGSEFTQIWLVGLADMLFRFALVGAVFFLVNPDGATSTTMPYTVMDPTAPLGAAVDDSKVALF